jgi:hypothetical protein
MQMFGRNVTMIRIGRPSRKKMNSDYFDLKQLQAMPGYPKLQALWAHEYIALMNGLQKAASKGQESAWRYYAGQLKGADLMTGLLDRALLQMEQQGENEAFDKNEKSAAEIIAELRGEGK